MLGSGRVKGGSGGSVMMAVWSPSGPRGPCRPGGVRVVVDVLKPSLASSLLLVFPFAFCSSPPFTSSMWVGFWDGDKDVV